MKKIINKAISKYQPFPKIEMEEKGATVLNEPRIGAHGTPIIFIHPKDSDGVLIELMESPKN